MNQADLREMMEFVRTKTLGLLAAIAKQPDPQAILGWRPGPGRAHLAWQFMHLAATDDRHLHVRMKGGEPREPEYVRRFAGGSVPDEQIPAVVEIKRYLEESRRELLTHLQNLSDSDLTKKPNEQAPWTYQEWFKILVWHEGHHEGQSHLTLNLYRAANEPAMQKVGH